VRGVKNQQTVLSNITYKQSFIIIFREWNKNDFLKAKRIVKIGLHWPFIVKHVTLSMAYS